MRNRKTMYKSRNLLPIAILLCLALTTLAQTSVAQTPQTTIHLPIFPTYFITTLQPDIFDPDSQPDTDTGFSGFEPPEVTTEFEQLFFGPLAAATDHNRDENYRSSVSFLNPYSTETTLTFKSFDVFGSPSGASETRLIEPFDKLSLSRLEDSYAYTEMRANYPIMALYQGFKGVIDDHFFAYVAPNISTQIYLPVLCKCDYETVIGIKNANDVDAVVTVRFSDGEELDVTVPAHTHRLMFQYLEAHGSETFAATLSSSVAISAAVLQTDSLTSRGYAGLTDTSSSLFFPSVNFDSASTTFANIQIYNTGSDATEVGVTYTSISTDTECTEMQTIQAGASVTFGGVPFNDGTNPDCSLGNGTIGSARLLQDGFIGSARVTTNSANQPLAGVVEQVQNDVGIGSYGAISEQDATNRIAFPLFTKVDDDEFESWDTLLHIMNVGSTDSDIECHFTHTEETETFSILAGSTAAFFLDSAVPGVPGTSVTSAICEGSNGAQLAAVSNISATIHYRNNEQLFATYKGINF